MTERRTRGNSNLMTKATYESLLREAGEADRSVKQSLLDIGTAAGSESDWHDNAAFDIANMQHDVHSSRLGTMQSWLRDVQIIGPSFETDSVHIGNTVVVKFASEPEEETFTILGPADSGRNAGWISYESPLGASLMGRTQGEEVSFNAGHNEQRVRIINIFQGNF